MSSAKNAEKLLSQEFSKKKGMIIYLHSVCIVVLDRLCMSGYMSDNNDLHNLISYSQPAIYIEKQHFSTFRT